MSSTALRAVKGMNDILPGESARWAALEHTVQALMQRWGYQLIRTPIVEPTALFVRGVGAATDIVEKEMYAFEDKLNGDALALRPEGTAGVVRAAIEHNLLYDGPKRVWYMGAMFRHERPQKGRSRQFHQIGVEAMGFHGADLDAEVILLVAALLDELGVLAHTRLEINSLGLPAERAAHRAALVAYFEAHASALDDEARRRLHSNPLRILDTKNPAMQALVEAAPRLADHLGEASRAHLAQVTAVLDAAGQPWVLNPRLVRGLDYYNHTVFEWVTERLGAQGTVCGGGRYDGLFEQLGGKSAPGVGWGLGMERLLALVEEVGAAATAPPPDVYAVVAAPELVPTAMATLATLRACGVAALMHPLGEGGAAASFKAQFKKAGASGARWALVFAPDEAASGEVTLKDLRQDPRGAGATEQQQRLALRSVTEWAAHLRTSVNTCANA